ncbi:MAG: 2-C-methyl-D-erythritol 4-phosphate cytidylyltransferase [Bacteroidia bacterium]|nr:2-C-methyl-D-erythritol 4-phosphate cytidylyltransferase [Bacteroidia bacterium]
MQKYALIVAGGKGLRMGSELPKQFIELNGLPVLMHTIKAFSLVEDIQIILVLPQSQLEFWKELCSKYNFTIPHKIATGGLTRFHSVQNGLNSISNDNSLVAIHDGVRPLISLDIILEGYRIASDKGNSVAVVPSKDSLRKQELLGNHSVNRANYYLVQTPQTFITTQIKQAYSEAKHDNFTDDAGVLEEMGVTIQMIEGSYKNIKITTPEDLAIAEALLKLK